MNEVTITSPFGCRINIEHILTHSPPPQDHVLPGLLAGIAGMIVGPGGVGKTMLELQIAMALSSGRAACGGLFDDLGLGMPSTQKPGKVVMVAAEESVGVIWHRMHAIVSSLARNSRLQCDHIAPKDMLDLWKENLHIYPFDGLPPVQLMDSALMKTEAFTKLISACEGARLVILEVFAALPVAQLVEFSGYSQRRSKVTGQMGDEYLLSVRVERPAWESIDFRGLKSIDVNESLAQFDLKRDQLKDGSFRAILPHKVPAGGT